MWAYYCQQIYWPLKFLTHLILQQKCAEAVIVIHLSGRLTILAHSPSSMYALFFLTIFTITWQFISDCSASLWKPLTSDLTHLQFPTSSTLNRWSSLMKGLEECSLVHFIKPNSLHWLTLYISNGWKGSRPQLWKRVRACAWGFKAL